jgi:RNA polymerase sigma factor (sigma-70 family)
MDDLAFTLLRHQRRLTTRVAQLVGSAEADDVMALALERLISHRENPAHDIDAFTHVRRVVDSITVEHVRIRNERREREHRFYEVRLAEPSPAIGYVQDALESLSPQQRNAVELVYFRGLDQRTAAVEMGITKGAVSRHLDRAKQKLRWRLAPTMSAA